MKEREFVFVINFLEDERNYVEPEEVAQSMGSFLNEHGMIDAVITGWEKNYPASTTR